MPFQNADTPPADPIGFVEPLVGICRGIAGATSSEKQTARQQKD
jgi:hypothetical protein